MAKTKSEIFALIGANFPDNQPGLITPEKLREVTTQMADSMLYGVKEVEVLRASSTDIQAPTTTGTALTVAFGGAQKTSADPVMISASGVVTFDVAGNYAIRVKLQAGRTGASGTSILLSRVLLGGAQFGSPAATKLTSADSTIPIESRVVVNATAGQTFTVEIMRDAAGSNFGGLYPQVATVTSWGVAPSALLVISRLEGV
ncbi:TPA: hypothetical protein MGM46_004482 [Salmonella enterica]|nr:hypothetical protein [Salmonella enterica]